MAHGFLSASEEGLTKSGYVSIEKTYRGKLPLTLCRLTEAGRKAFQNYRKTVKRALGR